MLTIGLATTITLVEWFGNLEWLVYDRSGIEAGQWWRLWTFQFAHWSLPHYQYNLLTLLATGILAETLSRRAYAMTVLGIMFVSGPITYLLMPGVQQVAGYSGIAAGAFMLALLLFFVHMLHAKDWLAVGVTAVGGTIFLAIELGLIRDLRILQQLVGFGQAEKVPSQNPWHLIGICIGGCCAYIQTRFGKNDSGFGD
ncbi:MAG: rhomboid family intramembrane serine protease [Chloroflexi bacterium]|nr:MAG: rhomboid family intramembrane serine protease [Chloroflexota bacterium]